VALGIADAVRAPVVVEADQGLTVDSGRDRPVVRSLKQAQRRLRAVVAPPVRWPWAGAPAMHYAFGNCVLDTQRYVLHRAGQPVRLRPKVFRLLVYLLTHRERVIPKQELSEQVWHGRFISDATLESTIAAGALALGGRGRDHRYIQTLHGHGYRFVAPVEECADPRPDAASAPSLPVAEAPTAAPPVAVRGVADNLVVSQETPARNLDRPPDTADRGRYMVHQPPGTGPVLPLPPGEGMIIPSLVSPGAGERKLVSVLCSEPHARAAGADGPRYTPPAGRRAIQSGPT
jgi:DNA-binding winged helix-turn-helix (wHTH) protein